MTPDKKKKTCLKRRKISWIVYSRRSLFHGYFSSVSRGRIVMFERTSWYLGMSINSALMPELNWLNYPVRLVFWLHSRYFVWIFPRNLLALCVVTTDFHLVKNHMQSEFSFRVNIVRAYQANRPGKWGNLLANRQ